ncbi:MAG: 5'-nucleotidase C-terminal domain-containing protein [Flammeovirgaceae bacterium]
MRILKIILIPICVIFLNACSLQKTTFNILQINDVYEIAPLEGGKVGGLARVAQIRQSLLQKNPNTITVLAGDFISPSLLGTLSDETGTKIRGKQMIETLNALGLDYATFGNHEFDIDSVSLQKRLNESTFTWLTSNVRRSGGRFFSKIYQGKIETFPTYIIREIKHQNKTLKIGIFAVTIPFNKQEYVEYLDITQTTEQMITFLKDKCDVLIALTHQDIAEDLKLAEKFPDIHFVIGGHDHTNMKYKVGNTFITKADANAKTVYIHKIRYDWKSKKVKISPKLKRINDNIAFEPKTEAVVQKWLNFAYKNLESLGYNPKEVIYDTKERLDGHESSVRNKETNLTRLIVEAVNQAFPMADGVILNSGSIRVDDVLTGKITQEDILRTMPFGDGIVLVKVKGDMLLKTLEIGRELNKGTGGFLQIGKIAKVNSIWQIQGKPIDNQKIYTIATSLFFSQGKEKNLDFFNFPDAEKPEKVNGIKNDVRDIVIDFLRKKKN